MSFPDPYTNRAFYRDVKIGGRPVKAALTHINGIKIEDKWDVQAPTGHSGATNVFKGTNPAGPAKLTFLAKNKAECDDLRELYEMLEPKAGAGVNGSGATSGSPGSAAYGQQFMRSSSPNTSAVTTTPEDLLRQATQALAALQSGAAATTPAATATSATATSTKATPSPGPKPPTLSIVNGFINYVGITSVSRKSWEGPIETPTRGYLVHVELVMQRDPVPAAVGKSAPKSPDNPASKSIAFGEIQDSAAAAREANQALARVGAH